MTSLCPDVAELAEGRVHAGLVVPDHLEVEMEDRRRWRM